MLGDADISIPAALLADSSRARIVMALADGRALPASVLAAEAGVSPSTASEHLARLVDASMLRAERHGRHRYYRIADRRVLQALEILSGIAPAREVRSLRDGTRAHAVRNARLCYDHLGGRLAVALMASLIERGLIAGGDGLHHPESARTDRLSAPGRDVDYSLTDAGADHLSGLGIDIEAISGGRRPMIRYCLDWSEQRHHLAGALGAAIAQRMLDLGWIRRAERTRAVHVTDEGHTGLADAFGLDAAAFR